MVFVVPNVGIGRSENIYSTRDLFDAIRSYIPLKLFFFSFSSNGQFSQNAWGTLIALWKVSSSFIQFYRVYVATDPSVPIPPAKLSNTQSFTQWEATVASVSKYCHYYHLLFVTCVGYLMLTYASCYSKISPLYKY